MKYSLNFLKENKKILIENNINPDMFFNSFKLTKISPFDNDNVIISFIIPSYNRYDMLKQTLQSIFKLKFKQIEVIVINDLSTDKRYENLQNEYSGFPIKFINPKSSIGPGLARKTGFNLAIGNYIVFIDDDDFYINDRFIEQGINKLKDKPDLSFVSFNTITYYENTQEVNISKINTNGYKDGEDYFYNFISKYQKPTSTFPTIFSKEKLDKADFKNMDMMNDASIYLRALTQGSAYIFDDYIGIYRVHKSNISKSISLKFIKDNIKEKNNIYRIASKTFNKNLDKWLFNQINDSLRYFIVDSNGKFNKVIELINYINKEAGISKISLYKEYIKALLIKLIILFR